MSKITFSFFLKKIQSIYKKRPNQQETIDSLFDEILLYSDNSSAYCISKQRANGMFNDKEPVPQAIVSASYNAEYVDNIYNYFTKMINEDFDSAKFELFINNLKEEISTYNNIPETIRNTINAAYETKNYAVIIAEIFLYTLRFDSENRDTNYQKNIKYQSSKKKSISRVPPKEDMDLKLPYIQALYEVYSEKENKNVTCIEDAPQYTAHYNRQLLAYFDAECVFHKTRDTYKNEEPFNELKAEMYDGIIETYENEYDSGYIRLQSVLSHASEVQFDSSVLCHETDWIKQSVKKGVCHYLVNDNKIKSWVNIDE